MPPLAWFSIRASGPGMPLTKWSSVLNLTAAWVSSPFPYVRTVALARFTCLLVILGRSTPKLFVTI
eukprot:6948858-Lingulodinium_polyedra.AAC.1